MGSEDVLTLHVASVEALTADSVTVTFEERRDFRPGQFLTLAVPSDLTGVAARCYSLCSVPGEALAVGVKRTVDGYASNWINDNLSAGDEIKVLEPSGIFTPASLDADLLLFAAGSGVTPIMSIARTALSRGSGRIVVFYANRDERSVMFASQWTALAAEFPERLQVVHWLETVQGLPTQDQVRAFIASSYLAYDAFVCGPAPFMRLVTGALKELEFPRERRHQEKFVSLGGNPFGDAVQVAEAESEMAEADALDDGVRAAVEEGVSRPGPTQLEVELDGTSYSFDDWDAGTTLLSHLESKGVKAPYSCREGECSACAFRLLEGEVKLLKNDVLDQEDLADGIRLGCQSLPVTDCVKLTYS
jgi:3-ketosteroid 9alpha-monooxygenase subunit B